MASDSDAESDSPPGAIASTYLSSVKEAFDSVCVGLDLCFAENKYRVKYGRVCDVIDKHGHVCPHELQVADESFVIDQAVFLPAPSEVVVFFTTKPALVNYEAGLKRFFSIAKR